MFSVCDTGRCRFAVCAAAVHSLQCDIHRRKIVAGICSGQVGRQPREAGHIKYKLAGCFCEIFRMPIFKRNHYLRYIVRSGLRGECYIISGAGKSYCCIAWAARVQAGVVLYLDAGKGVVVQRTGGAGSAFWKAKSVDEITALVFKSQRTVFVLILLVLFTVGTTGKGNIAVGIRNRLCGQGKAVCPRITRIHGISDFIHQSSGRACEREIVIVRGIAENRLFFLHNATRRVYRLVRYNKLGIVDGLVFKIRE